jgi:hypothetical protein
MDFNCAVLTILLSLLHGHRADAKATVITAFDLTNSNKTCQEIISSTVIFELTDQKNEDRHICPI